MSTQVNRAPKRRIERIRNILGFTPTDTLNERILHTAEDAKTLVRTIIDLYFVDATNGTTLINLHAIIQLAQAGVVVLAPNVGQSLDKPAPIALITEKKIVSYNAASGNVATIIHWQADLKSMRKMKENDQINLSTIQNATSGFQVHGTVTLFFKE